MQNVENRIKSQDLLLSLRDVDRKIQQLHFCGLLKIIFKHNALSTELLQPGVITEMHGIC